MGEMIAEKAKGKGGKGGAGQMFEKLFDIMDANKDGSLTIDEYRKLREKLNDRQKNKKDGK
jgi:Ca2+-binding EF-hand superfamily protein